MLSICLSVVLFSQAQTKPSSWVVNPNNALIWNGKPYLPVGAAIEGTVDQIEKAKTAGLHDVLVRLPIDRDWTVTLDALEAAGLQYLIQINSLAPSARGIVVEPEAYRITGITGPITGSIEVPGAQEALLILVTQRDGSVQLTEKRPVTNGKLALDLDPGSELEHVLLIYPTVLEARIPDYWAGLDQHRDTLLTRLRAMKERPGLRGIVNPLGKVLQFPNPRTQFVPTSPLFQMELEQFLRRKYTTVTTALKSWSITAPDFDSFRPLSRMIPLWSAQRGVPYLYDSVNDRTYKVDSKQSLAWRDIQEVMYSTSDRRYQRLSNSIRAIANVPIIQDWQGWTGPYEGTATSLTGIGIRLGESEATKRTDEASRPASSILRWTKPGWLVVTNAPLGEQSLSDQITDLSSLGVRGWFMEASDDESLKKIAEESDRRANDQGIANWKPTAVFYPEAATNPASPSPLPGGKWWLPAPMDGNRIDLGPLYGAYLYRDGIETVMAIWANEVPRRTKLRASDPKSLSFGNADLLELRPKIGKDWVEITIPTTPMTIRGASDVPIPEDAVLDSRKTMDGLLEQVEKRFGVAAEEKFSYNQATQTMERSPGSGYLDLRRQILGLSYRLSDAIWTEAEGCRNTNWSESRQTSGCSSGAALFLQGRLPSGPLGYYATYEADVRIEGDYQIWVAARISKANLPNLALHLGDQILRAERGPLSIYGQQFAWYYFGSRSLGKGTNPITLRIDSPGYVDAALDVVLLTPRPFRPNGVMPPEVGLSP